MSVTAIICAAGKGERAGFQKNKLLQNYCGEPVLLTTVKAFDFALIDEIVVAVSACDFDEITALCAPYTKTKIVLGGNCRAETVKNALTAATGDIVLIHDGARPFVSREIIENCVKSVQEYGSGICAVPVTDTIAVAEDNLILDVPDRNSLCRIQTPQGFYLKDIVCAYAHARKPLNEYTDDSSVFAEYFENATLCQGSEKNSKLTFAEDFAPAARVGFGVDTHAFGKEQNYITLCGVKVPSDSGLIAHSDGDVAIHALMDALLSAAGLRDIGFYFPDTDEKWRGADSMKMLEQVLELLVENGYRPKNVSVAIQAEKPRLAKHILEMKTRLAAALKIDETAVGITAGTNEKLGYVGEGKGITVYAYVLLQ